MSFSPSAAYTISDRDGVCFVIFINDIISEAYFKVKKALFTLFYCGGFFDGFWDLFCDIAHSVDCFSDIFFGCSYGK